MKPRRIAIAPSPTILAAGLCLAALVSTAWLTTAVFDRLPHVEDEVAFLFQARTIAAGRLTAPAPPLPGFFSIPFTIIHDGAWFGKYPPGYPAVLALGVLAGQPWLLNPFFGALSVGLIYLAGRRLYGAPTALLAAALAVTSPFFLLQAASFLSHVVSLFWAIAFLLLFKAARDRSSVLVGLAAGAILGALFLTRPLTAVGIGLPFAIWALVDLIGSRRKLPLHLAIAAGFLPFVGTLLAYNQSTIGSALRMGYQVYWSYDRIGFGEGIGSAGIHTFEMGLLNTSVNLESLAQFLFGWPWSLSLLPAALATLAATLHLLAAAAGARPGSTSRMVDSFAARQRPRAEAWDMLLVAIVASLIAVHIAYWTPGEMYGPRYYFEAFGALMLLSARGILLLGHGVALAIGPLSRVRPGASMGVTVALLLATAGLSGLGLRGFTAAQLGHYTRWYGIDSSGPRLVQEARIGNAVVFVAAQDWTGYAPFFSQNAPTLDSDVVFALDLGPEQNRNLMAVYPGRHFYRYEAERLTPTTP